ncbi:MAG: NAD(P)H-quinone oxidoreductase [Vulcanimicrobiaceae bacterium]
MRAAIYTGAGGREVVAIRDDVPEPELGSDDILVAVAYAGLNRADLLERRGLYPAPGAGPPIPGLEFSGVVRALGSRARAVAVGDAVCGIVAAGAHAERLTTHALAVAKIPPGLALRTAAALPEAYVTAHDALFARADLRLGETVLVHAVGSGVGLAALGLARRIGARTLGTSRTPAKLVRARGLGLDVGIVFDDDWLAGVRAATDGRGADVILDFAGGSTLERNCAALAAGGRIVQIGALAGARATLDLGVLMAKRGTLHGTVLRSRSLAEKIGLHATFERAILPLVARGDLETSVDATFPLDRLADAHERMESDANFGKILIAVGGDDVA